MIKQTKTTRVNIKPTSSERVVFDSWKDHSSDSTNNMNNSSNGSSSNDSGNSISDCGIHSASSLSLSHTDIWQKSFTTNGSVL